MNPKGRDTEEEDLIFNAEPHRPISAALSWLAAEGEDAEQTDGMVAREAIRLIEEQGDEPWFLGVGFFRPHTPFVAPKAYFDLYSPTAASAPSAGATPSGTKVATGASSTTTGPTPESSATSRSTPGPRTSA